MYSILRRLFFLFDAEKAHYGAMNLFKAACAVPFLRSALQNIFTVSNPSLHRSAFGLHFKNPVGLGAGFDKNALYLKELQTLGFGFIEIGTVTPKPQKGNDKPRLFRLKKDGALINRMGFNNDGVEAVVERLKKWRTKDDSWRMAVDGVAKNLPTPNYQLPTFLIGGNIGKNKDTLNEEAWKDYEICFTALHSYVDFFVVNVSSPNTPGLRELQEKESLKKILTHLQTLNTTQTTQRPILLKIAPDLTLRQIDDVINLALEIKLDGLVATNTTVDRTGLHTTTEQIETGGLSGKPLLRRSTDIVHYIHQKANGTLPIIGSGGVFTGANAGEKIEAGASLVEVWTGFIYEGPFIVRNICKHLVLNSFKK